MAKAITLRSAEEIEILRQANRIVAETLQLLRENSKVGISTWQLDQIAEKYARSQDALPAFKGYRGFPASLCVSLNEEVVHGIPSRKVRLKEGDIVSIDFGVKYKGYYGDAAITVEVGKVDEKKKKLLKVTEESLYKGIKEVLIGGRVNDVSAAIQQHVEENGFSVVRQFVGHGIGTQLHEPPEIPNYSRPESTPRLLAGMILAIEPMVNMGGAAVKILRDGWTVVTADRQPSAHFEHSVAVTENGPLILSQLG